MVVFHTSDNSSPKGSSGSPIYFDSDSPILLNKKTKSQSSLSKRSSPVSTPTSTKKPDALECKETDKDHTQEHSPTETGCTISTRGHSGGIRNSHLYTPEMKVKPYTGEGLIRTRFDKAKEEVDSYLSTFAGNLVGVLKRSIETHPEWEETVVDLLALAHSCVMTAPGEFWFKCEGIVQDLDDRRKKLPAGLLKHLHTQMLIILTRCTRVVQLLKGSGLAEDYNIFQLSQSLQPPDRSMPSMGMDEGGAANPFKVPPTRKFTSQEQQEELKNKLTVQTEYYSSSPESMQDLDTPSRNLMAPWKKFSSPAVKTPVEDVQVKDVLLDNDIEASKLLHNRRRLPAADLGSAEPSEQFPKDPQGHYSNFSKQEHKVSWGQFGDQPGISYDSSTIYQICEEEVPTLHVDDCSSICAIADQCNEDRPSNLPDEILSLAGLKTIQVVGLSRLGKRWNSIWKTMPFIDVDFKRS
ncbi:non-receptor serine/threonine protein kinase [Lithospermum erythrorhizon]|uniref:Non-receptor serine/threonine protein kinase n=1 Tax=Lithospermum erythrorhizon TaxID=34254 RepID=A0AAV3RZT5_LITER